MSFDERILDRVVRAASRVRLEFIVIGNAGAALHNVPILTEDIDLFVRHTPRNLQKIHEMARVLGGVTTQPHEPTSRMMRLLTPDFTVDFVFDLSSRRKFESVRARSPWIKLGRQKVRVASLEDIIMAKEAAGRPKVKASLPILKSALRVAGAMRQKM